MYKEKIVNALTGEETWRDYTAAEIAEVETAAAQAEANCKAAEAEAQAKAKAKASAFNKLEALGLTPDDLKALGL